MAPERYDPESGIDCDNARNAILITRRWRALLDDPVKRSHEAKQLVASATTGVRRTLGSCPVGYCTGGIWTGDVIGGCPIVGKLWESTKNGEELIEKARAAPLPVADGPLISRSWPHTYQTPRVPGASESSGFCTLQRAARIGEQVLTNIIKSTRSTAGSIREVHDAIQQRTLLNRAATCANCVFWTGQFKSEQAAREGCPSKDGIIAQLPGPVLNQYNDHPWSFDSPLE